MWLILSTKNGRLCRRAGETQSVRDLSAAFAVAKRLGKIGNTSCVRSAARSASVGSAESSRRHGWHPPAFADLVREMVSRDGRRFIPSMNDYLISICSASSKADRVPASVDGAPADAEALASRSAYSLKMYTIVIHSAILARGLFRTRIAELLSCSEGRTWRRTVLTITELTLIAFGITAFVVPAKKKIARIRELRSWRGPFIGRDYGIRDAIFQARIRTWKNDLVQAAWTGRTQSLSDVFRALAPCARRGPGKPGLSRAAALEFSFSSRCDDGCRDWI